MKVTIVGGGLGGLTLARVLHVNGVDATVYELDASPTARDQGGTLDMHEESGQRALRAAGLYDEFRAVARDEGEAMRLLDGKGFVYHEDVPDEPGGRPEVDRSELKRILVQSLPVDTVRWGTKVVGVDPAVITLADGTTVESDLIVGADGAWSKVRPLLSDARPVYSGLSFVEAHLSDVDAKYPGSAAFVGPGTMFALADGKGVIAQRNGDGRIRVYIAMRAADENWVAADVVDPADPVQTRLRLLEIFDDFAEPLRALIADGDDVFVPRPIHALPVGHHWSRVPGVTLLGDAAHLMSPFAGEGANLAMLDGAELALALTSHDDVEQALTAYEAAMFPRAEAAARESATNLVVCFEPDGPARLLARMAG
ncbi:NAD(P)/FAD-dependent oxidoreductase [Kutzneria buriramensis]|uniref:Flavin-dependent monooxygenase n=1 Tax=Kutzneria buriramensis TaxID=1045776 RepID=A0A3E0HEI4_9PSEU|nr:NAD(P)/FAD-dependent oxidoreductase [Kutzneria buriramensis]REH43681.1 2-polyprenyl-6-methoxyphenol hydroxylase-like FAD-dependent oxidoreductase [Kutzneria buriramensis]